jgi:hypothetical protein
LVAFANRPAPRASGLVELALSDQVRYDKAINRVIEDVEARHGMRAPRVLAPGESAERDPIVDDEAVKEIELLYDRKRLRDQARGIRYGPPDTSSPQTSLAQPAPSSSPTSPASSGTPSSGGRRVD